MTTCSMSVSLAQVDAGFPPPDTVEAALLIAPQPEMSEDTPAAIPVLRTSRREMYLRPIFDCVAPTKLLDARNLDRARNASHHEEIGATYVQNSQRPVSLRDQPGRLKLIEDDRSKPKRLTAQCAVRRQSRLQIRRMDHPEPYCAANCFLSE